MWDWDLAFITSNLHHTKCYKKHKNSMLLLWHLKVKTKKICKKNTKNIQKNTNVCKNTSKRCKKEQKIQKTWTNLRIITGINNWHGQRLLIDILSLATLWSNASADCFAFCMFFPVSHTLSEWASHHRGPAAKKHVISEFSAGLPDFTEIFYGPNEPSVIGYPELS